MASDCSAFLCDCGNMLSAAIVLAVEPERQEWWYSGWHWGHNANTYQQAIVSECPPWNREDNLCMEASQAVITTETDISGVV